VIAHAVRLYLRFALSCHDVEELLADRGIKVSHETVRRWVARFGTYCAALGRVRFTSESARAADGWGRFSPLVPPIAWRRQR
jgi:transposase-like protein